MEDEVLTVLAVIGSIIGVVVIVALVLRQIDHERIEAYLISQNARLVHMQRAPWQWHLGEQNSRYYRVRYQDEHEDVREALCRINLLSRVYFTEDRIISRRTPDEEDSEIARLQQENERLREEIDRLRQG